MLQYNTNPRKLFLMFLWKTTHNWTIKTCINPSEGETPQINTKHKRIKPKPIQITKQQPNQTTKISVTGHRTHTALKWMVLLFWSFDMHKLCDIAQLWCGTGDAELTLAHECLSVILSLYKRPYYFNFMSPGWALNCHGISSADWVPWKQSCQGSDQKTCGKKWLMSAWFQNVTSSLKPSHHFLPFATGHTTWLTWGFELRLVLDVLLGILIYENM